MKTIKLISSILFIILCSSILEAKEDLGIIKCVEPYCYETATEITPETTDSTSNYPLNINLPNFSIDIPSNPQAIYQSGSALIAVYHDNKLISIEETSGPELSGEKITLSPSILPEIIFLKTSKDKEPEEYANKLFWRVGLNLKQHYFTTAKTTVFFKKDQYTYYLSDCNTQGFTARALVTNSNQTSLFLQIDTRGYNVDVLKEIVKTIK